MTTATGPMAKTVGEIFKDIAQNASKLAYVRAGASTFDGVL